MPNTWQILVLLVAVGLHSVAGDCLQDRDNATVPRCSDWIDHSHDDIPIFFSHQYNCSRFWVCNVDYTACLRECAPGFNHTVLYFDESIDYYHGGPTCNYPQLINCTSKPAECAKCEAWQDCQIMDDGSVICLPDCKLDVHCNDDEYCDWEEGGDGSCQKGCRNGKPCGSGSSQCAECVNHVCNEPECCDNSDCNGMACSTCENDHCVDPECCTDDDCLDSEYCSDNQECRKGCNEDSDCADSDQYLACSTCNINAHQCSDPECCVDDDCEGAWICENNKCKPECVTDDDCDSNEYCNTVEGICKVGCRNDAGCTGTTCSTCEDHVCVDPECCVGHDEMCLDSEYCSDEQKCEPGCNEDSDCATSDLPCTKCNLDAHECNNPECCVDDDCQGAWMCEDYQCKPECVTDDDCDANEYCNTVEGICKVGCRNDAGCSGTACSTCEDHVCVDPECCVDKDCVDPDKPICSEDNLCVEGCRDDSYCPGYDAICNANHDNCNYCNNPDPIGTCDPGCVSDENCADDMKCPSNTHFCTPSGAEVLDTISFTTSMCTDCGSSKTEPGLSLFLNGKRNTQGETFCQTKTGLDNENKIDYMTDQEATFRDSALGQCEAAVLQTEIKGGNATWNGQGMWGADKGQIYFTWSSNAVHYVCTLEPPTLSDSSPHAQLVDCKEDW